MVSNRPTDSSFPLVLQGDIAYLLADINVANENEIKEIYEAISGVSLSLSITLVLYFKLIFILLDSLV